MIFRLCVNSQHHLSTWGKKTRSLTTRQRPPASTRHARSTTLGKVRQRPLLANFSTTRSVPQKRCRDSLWATTFMAQASTWENVFLEISWDFSWENYSETSWGKILEKVLEKFLENILKKTLKGMHKTCAVPFWVVQQNMVQAPPRERKLTTLAPGNIKSPPPLLERQHILHALKLSPRPPCTHYRRLPSQSPPSLATPAPLECMHMKKQTYTARQASARDKNAGTGAQVGVTRKHRKLSAQS